jgi:FMN phosphatase YigB (HAD superfamily)
VYNSFNPIDYYKIDSRHQEQAILAQITVVTFDLWQTLLLDNRELGRARAQVRLEGAQQALYKFGEEYDLEHIRGAYRACYRHCHKVRERNLDVSFREQVEIFINKISPRLVDRLPEEITQEIIRAYADSFFVHPPIPHVDATAVLSGIKKMGLRVGLISNTGMTPGVAFRRFLDEHGMLRYFDILTFSDEVKLAKPSDEIFLMTLRALGASPDESIHVGDHVQNDVIGANRAGMKTIWIEGFYSREDHCDPNSEPDLTVPGLGMVVPAVAKLMEKRASA